MTVCDLDPQRCRPGLDRPTTHYFLNSSAICFHFHQLQPSLSMCETHHTVSEDVSMCVFVFMSKLTAGWCEQHRVRSRRNEMAAGDAQDILGLWVRLRRGFSGMRHTSLEFSILSHHEFCAGCTLASSFSVTAYVNWPCGAAASPYCMQSEAHYEKVHPCSERWHTLNSNARGNFKM